MLNRLESHQATEKLARTGLHTAPRAGAAVPDWEAPRAPHDRNEVSPLPTPDGIQLVQGLLDTIAQAYPDVRVRVAELSGREEVRQYALRQGMGVTLVLSPEFLKKLEEGGETFLASCELLDRVLSALCAGADDSIGVGAYVGEKEAFFWAAAPEEEEQASLPGKTGHKTLFDWIREAQERAKKLEEGRISVSAGNLRNGLMQTYYRLSQARSVPDVKGVISGAQQMVQQLKVIASLGSDSQKEQAHSLLGQMDKAITRARGKIRALTDEADCQRRQRSAEEEQESQKAAQLAVERKRRQAARQARESAQLNEALIWSYQQMQRERQRVSREEQVEQILPGTAFPAAEPMQTGGIVGGAASAPVMAEAAVSESMAVVL